MFKEILKTCMEGGRLSQNQAEQAMDEIMEGRATESQIASLVTVLRYRGETVDEMTGFAASMRSHVVPLKHDEDYVIDTCGTGGDMSSTYNISTASAIGISSLGIPVAKHGNRSVSSKSGSADVLEALGLPVQTTPETAAQSLRRHHLAFLFAPLYHTSMKHAVTPRKEIGFRTIFNLLGPLTNPAGARSQVIGVFDKDYGRKMAEALSRLGAERALFVTGSDGMDEITTAGPTYMAELKNGDVTEYTVTPEDFGLKTSPVDDARVQDISESAELIQAVFTNGKQGAARDILLMNMAAGLYTAGKCRTFKEGAVMAAEAVDHGTVKQHLQNLRQSEGNACYASSNS
ncbi:anthranilate phosphoribosyltransferase [Salibacterium halotolerans]|uniref:Anthranilate phosphoribosyltransferase n=1 Tax=Salibacterium halotolerans TaxID=1884432 RepID=A0A1I5Q6A8_9BACI|nr:anthranilate phosphoribosyltransferase [Salibacterium halotolerans]SFP41884.1 anthranilate phosphoribosyltransferase [Salibacterium halotolerans]